MAREWDYFFGIESMTHCMPQKPVGAPRRGLAHFLRRAHRDGTSQAEARLVRGERPKAHSIVPDGQ